VEALHIQCFIISSSESELTRLSSENVDILLSQSHWRLQTDDKKKKLVFSSNAGMHVHALHMLNASDNHVATYYTILFRTIAIALVPLSLKIIAKKKKKNLRCLDEDIMQRPHDVKCVREQEVEHDKPLSEWLLIL